MDGPHFTTRKNSERPRSSSLHPLLYSVFSNVPVPEGSTLSGRNAGRGAFILYDHDSRLGARAADIEAAPRILRKQAPVAVRATFYNHDSPLGARRSRAVTETGRAPHDRIGAASVINSQSLASIASGSLPGTEPFVTVWSHDRIRCLSATQRLNILAAASARRRSRVPLSTRHKRCSVAHYHLLPSATL